jgi:hypothetical protein
MDDKEITQQVAFLLPLNQTHLTGTYVNPHKRGHPYKLHVISKESSRVTTEYYIWGPCGYIFFFFLFFGYFLH